MRRLLKKQLSLRGGMAVLMFCAAVLMTTCLVASDRTEMISTVDPAVIQELREMTLHLDGKTLGVPDGAPPGANIALGGSNEPTIAIDPNNRLNICAASLWSMRVSTDGGITFQPTVDAVVPTTHDLCGDPSVGYDSQGRLFWAYLGCAYDAQGDFVGIDIFLAQCDPTSGAILPGYPVNVTASAGVNLPGHSGNSHDKEWLAVDFYPGSPYTDNLYMTWTDFTPNPAVIRTTVSTDQGMTWAPSIILSGAGEGFVWPCHNTVAPNGDVYVAYHDQVNFAGGPPAAPDGISGRVWVCRSTNGGGSFPQKTTAFDPGEADITFNRQAAPGTIPGTQFWLQGSAQPFIMADPNTPGRIYVVANDDSDNNHGSGDDADVYIATSTNSGVNWNGPVRIDDGPGTSFQVMPTAAIDPVTGCMVVHYYDNRAGAVNAAGRFLLDVFAQSSSDGGVTWSPSFQINDDPFDPDPGARCRYGPLFGCGTWDPVVTTRIGEYNGVAVSNGLGFAVWCGNTFTGSTPTGQQMMFDRFAFDTQAPVIDCPPDFSAECTAPGGTPRSEIAGQLIATATDQCDVQPEITDDGPAFFPLGLTTVTFTATDDAGNSSTCQTDVTIVDTTPPTIACPGDVIVECVGTCGVPKFDPQLDAFWAGLSASDVCCLQGVTDDSPACFDFGITTVTFTATDCSGNTSQCTADVTVVDTTPPVITCPDNITVACNGPQGTYASDPQLSPFWTGVSATDICDADPFVTNNAPVLLPIGTTPVTFIAVDNHGNASSCDANVTVVDQGIDIWLTDLIVNPGDNVMVPVYIQDVTGWDLMGFEMELCWCSTPAGLLQFEYCVPGEVMINSNWPDPFCNPCYPNCISIAAAGAAPLVGEGVLFYVKFHVSTLAKPCMCCALELGTVNLYDPENPLFACWKNGSICVEWCDVAGCMKYWKCCPDGCGGYVRPLPLEGVQVHLEESCSGEPLATTFTSPDGCYEFECLEPLGQDCHYSVHVDYCAIPRCITPFDASLVLRYLACLEDLADCPFPYDGGMVYPQQVAADVTCSSGITSYDASMILQYFVGLIPAFPCFEPWVFYALGPDLNNVYMCPGTVDWIGVLIGDVSGCFECGEFAPPPITGDPVQVALGIPNDLGDRIEVPIVVQGAAGIFSSNFDLVYDPDNLSVISALATGLATGSMSAHNALGGDLIFAMAGSEAYGGDGEIGLITFGKLNPDANASSVELTAAMFNEGDPPAEIGVSAGIPAQTGRTALGRAVPNPFTQGTVISYQMAAAGQVSIEIYNVEGQLVRTLVSGGAEAGPHSILWNGKDDYGRMAARGVYFCYMEADGYQATEKIVFMK
jgi:hypothetical protein